MQGKRLAAYVGLMLLALVVLPNVTYPAAAALGTTVLAGHQAAWPVVLFIVLALLFAWIGYRQPHHPWRHAAATAAGTTALLLLAAWGIGGGLASGASAADGALLFARFGGTLIAGVALGIFIRKRKQHPMFDSWAFKMAWRDSRGSRRRMLLFVTSMVLGVAALVAINSFGENLEDAVDAQARTLLGADFSLESDRPYLPETEAIIDSLGGDQSRRVSFASMAFFPRTGSTRLSTVRAQDGAYPYYGAVETDPPAAARTYLTEGTALVDGTLMTQFEVQVGDSVTIGRRTYAIAGELKKTPRESAAIMLFSPRIYVPLAGLDTTLLSQGSRAEYEVYFKFDDDRDVEAMAEGLRTTLRAQKVSFDTVQEEQENWSESLRNLYRFLSLVGFMALLLGSLGVASAVHVYIRQRVETVAVLRCFGAKSWRTFSVYVIQATAMGLVGALAGCLLGVGVQMFIPYVLSDFLPVDVTVALSWRAIALGIGVGVGVTLLFALLPLVSIRRISPLLALRSSVEPEEGMGRDPLRWGLYVLVAAAVAGFAVLQAPNLRFGLGYAAGLGVVFGLLAAVAKGIMVLTRKYFPTRWSYVWRQGLANLYRPNNQTLLMMLALGLGTFLIMTMYLVQQTLVAQVEFSGGEGRPNLVFFDIQPAQMEGVSQVVEAEGLDILDRVPIVTMRVSGVKGETVEAMRADSTRNVTWAHRREYRSTYRDYLTDSEAVVAGTFGEPPPGGGDAVPISIEQDIADNLSVGLGDEVVFDVQGLLVTTVVTSIREVDWQRMQTNFFVVFPSGVLEEAPQFNVLLTHAPDDAASAAVQSAVVQGYPNVSAIDLSLVLTVFDAIFSRISFVIRFMALFSILTGLIVLAGAVVVSRYQRIEESVLLKTLGASRRQVRKIMLVEYLFLGLLASATGLLLALVGSWLLSFFVFETVLVAPPLAMGAALVVVVSLTVGIGLFNSRGIYDRPPLEVLRVET